MNLSWPHFLCFFVVIHIYIPEFILRSPNGSVSILSRSFTPTRLASSPSRSSLLIN